MCEPQPPNLDQIYVQQTLPGMGRMRVVSLIQLTVPTDALEFIVALITTAWSAWILVWYVLQWLWWEEADLGHPTNILNWTFALVPQWVWGLLGISMGTTHLLTRLSSLRRRMGLLFLTSCFWSAIAVTIAVRVPYSTGVPAYGGLALSAVLSYLRLFILHGRKVPW